MSDWKSEIKKLGKREFERREMERLGFWPPAPANGDTPEQIREKLRPISVELRKVAEAARPLREELGEVETLIAKNGDVEAQLKEIRQKRIERVKRARIERRAQREREKTEKTQRDKTWRSEKLPHLGRGVSGRLDFSAPSDAEKLAQIGAPLWNEPRELAEFLGISVAQLAWLCYHREAAPIDHYSHFTIPKKSGGTRQISAPRPLLKAAQTAILHAVLEAAQVHSAAAAFRPQTHIGHNAQRHAHIENGGPSVLLKIDLKDFFPSITFRRIAGVFANLGYNRGISTLLALLCTESPRVEATFEGEKSHVAVGARFVPQGAPTSPALTNLLCRRLDARLEGLAAFYGFVYSRYADDLVFSSAQNDPKTYALKRGVLMILEAEQLAVNPEKISVSRRAARQSVTGLVINGGNGQRLSRRDLRRFRAVCHDIQTNGEARVSEKMGQHSISYARGYLAFIHMVSPQTATKFREQFVWLQNSST